MLVIVAMGQSMSALGTVQCTKDSTVFIGASVFSVAYCNHLVQKISDHFLPFLAYSKTLFISELIE